MPRRFYLTTAIAYANAKPHIGHALEMLYADVLARYHRLCGDDVAFATGTDEHGQKIVRRADENGVSPQALTDTVSEQFRVLAKQLQISHTDFVRTTEDRHKRAVAEFWTRVAANGFIYKKSYAGLYCVGCEEFKTEKSLVDGLCPDHKTAPEFVEQENYFFKLTAFADQLKELYTTRPDFCVPEHKFNEVKQLLADGLEDISISRSTEQLTWGIPVPGDSTQVIYVWFDALVNYLTAASFPDTGWETKWPADLHVIGKEINRFHTVLWPAMLMAAGIPLPRQVAVHGWITAEGQKMSKSIGNVVEPEAILDRYGVDAARYLLISQVPFTSDGDWTDERTEQKYVADLANNLGNMVFRVTSMLQKYFDGVVPTRVAADVSVAWETYQTSMASYRFDFALDAVLALATSVNQEIDQHKPWAMAKAGETDALAGLMYRWLETIRQIAWMIRPTLPETSDRILSMLGQRIDAAATLTEVAVWGGLEPGAVVSVGEPLFPRIERDTT